MVKSRQSDVSCRVTLVMAACLSASPLLATSSFVSRSEYLDLMEAAVSAYSDEHMASYVEDTEKNGVQEHGFPRLTANLGFLAANGRLPAKRETFKRMMSLAYRAFAVKQILELSSPGYFSEGDEIGHFLLKHSVGSKPDGSEVDVPVNYADYYFLEALHRFLKPSTVRRSKADISALFGIH